MEYTSEERKNISKKDYNYIKSIDISKSKKETYYFEETYVYSSYSSYINKEKPTRVLTKKISKEMYDSSNQRIGYGSNYTLKSTGSDFHETNAKKISIIISNMPSNPKEKIVSSFLTWKTMPSVRSHDVFALRSTGGYLIPSTQSGTYTYKTQTMDSGCGGYVIGTNNINITSGWTKSSIPTILHGTAHSGVGYTVKLKGNDFVCINDLGMFMYETILEMNFRLYTKAYSTSSNNQVTIHSTYQHSTTNLAYNNVFNKYAFVAGGLGNTINFTNGYNSYFDGMGGVIATY